MTARVSEHMSEYETIVEAREYEDEEFTSSSEPEAREIAMWSARLTTQTIAKKSLIWACDYLEKLPIKLTLGNLGFVAIVLAIVMPRAFTYILVYPIFRLVFGTLYPAYASYKAVRTKNVKEYVKWMMYWIVFALFTCAETFTDVFFSFWFPFYYEIKIILVLWLLSPATKGSSILYRRFVHPALSRREAEIDDALARATEQGYTAVLHLGTRGVNYATTVLMQTAIKGGGGLVQQLKKSYSLSDLTGEKEDENRNTSSMRDETDMEVEPRRREHPGRRGYSPRRTQSSSNRVEMYFSEVDVDVRQPRPTEPIASLTNIRSSDDISSGYSSGEALQSNRVTSQGDSLQRTSSVGARTRAKPRSSATTKKITEGSVALGEEDCDNDMLPFPSENEQFPAPISLLSARQVLELVLLLSRINPSENKDVYESIASSFAGKRRGTNDSGDSDPFTPVDENSLGIAASSDILEPTTEESNKQLVTNTIDEVVDVKTIADNSSYLTRDKEDTTSDNTDEICRDKLEELKVLLSDARRAVTNIVSSHEKPHSTERNETIARDEARCEVDGEHAKTHDTKRNSTSSLETWTTPCVSRSNSDSDCRAGKYHKKPAPKAPTSRYVDDAQQDETSGDTSSTSALKATLVIKTGTLKTFTNVSETKNVFVSHLPDSVKKRKKKSRGKDGFSKLLTIPKTLFNHTFYKDARDQASGNVKIEGVSSSETSGSRSRSVSVGSRDEMKIYDSNGKEKIESEDPSLKVALVPDDKKTETYVDFRTDSLDLCSTNDETKILDPAHDRSSIIVPEPEDRAPETKSRAVSALKIRQMSHSPNRSSRKSLNDCE